LEVKNHIEGSFSLASPASRKGFYRYNDSQMKSAGYLIKVKFIDFSTTWVRASELKRAA
jgi:hypothetical protein